MNILLKISGIVIIIVGMLLTMRPDLIVPSASHYSGYEMIEKRVGWGFVIGVGIFLIVFQQWGQWGMTIWAFLAALSCGIVIARLTGLLLDGFFMKQLIWLVIEIVVGAIFTLLYSRLTSR